MRRYYGQGGYRGRKGGGWLGGGWRWREAERNEPYRFGVDPQPQDWRPRSGRIRQRQAPGGHGYDQPRMVQLPEAPRNASPVPSLTSIHAVQGRGDYGDSSYPGNCGGYLIKDVLRYFQPRNVLDPMTGSGTCYDVCMDLGIPCMSTDLHTGADASESTDHGGLFDFVWLHPPYWRQKVYSDDPRDLSTAKTLDDFLAGYTKVIANCSAVLQPHGRMAILMGDYHDKEVGFVPLVYHTKRICFELGLVQVCTDIVRFSYGASSSHKEYRTSFIPGLHDILAIFGWSQEGNRWG